MAAVIPSLEMALNRIISFCLKKADEQKKAKQEEGSPKFFSPEEHTLVKTYFDDPNKPTSADTFITSDQRAVVNLCVDKFTASGGVIHPENEQPFIDTLFEYFASEDKRMQDMHNDMALIAGKKDKENRELAEALRKIQEAEIEADLAKFKALEDEQDREAKEEAKRQREAREQADLEAAIAASKQTADPYHTAIYNSFAAGKLNHEKRLAAKAAASAAAAEKATMIDGSSQKIPSNAGEIEGVLTVPATPQPILFAGRDEGVPENEGQPIAAKKAGLK